MKKTVLFAKRIAILVTAVLLVAAALVACDPVNQDDDGFGTLLQRYEKTTTAAQIDQSIEVKDGNIVVYELQKTLQKEEGKYAVSETERRLNKIEEGGSEEQYATTTRQYDLETADNAVAGLNLKKEYFKTIVSLSEDGLAGDVKDSNVKDILKLDAAELTTNIQNMHIEIVVENGTVTQILIEYLDGGNNVTIELAFAY